MIGWPYSRNRRGDHSTGKLECRPVKCLSKTSQQPLGPLTSRRIDGSDSGEGRNGRATPRAGVVAVAIIVVRISVRMALVL